MKNWVQKRFCNLFRVISVIQLLACYKAILHSKYYFMQATENMNGCIQFNSIYFGLITQHWWIQGGARDASPPSGSKFFHFHVVFSQKIAKQ